MEKVMQQGSLREFIKNGQIFALNDAMYTVIPNPYTIYIAFLNGKEYVKLILDHANYDPMYKDGKIFTKLMILIHASSKMMSLIDIYLNVFMEHPKIKPYQIIIRSNKDIDDLRDKYVVNGRSEYIYPVRYVDDPRIFMRNGFFPTTIPQHRSSILTDYVNNVSNNVIDFWNDNWSPDLREILPLLKVESRWSYKTIYDHKKNGIENADSLPLLMFAPEMTYKGSKRPFNDMSMFRSPASHRISRNDVIIDQNTIDVLVTIDSKQYRAIPVTRYAAGMKRGLFNAEGGEKEYCGTFYYYEPESTTLLIYGTGHVSFNKYRAMLEIDANNPIIYTYYENLILNMYTGGLIPGDLMLTPLEAHDIYRKKYPMEDDYWSSDKVAILPQDKHYAGEYLGLYAVEDKLDQPLCIACNKKGYDIIVLTNMPGSHQTVVEVLDTRSREESFKNLIYIV